MIETAIQARAIAAWCRYRPEGVRGLAFGIGHDGYSGGDVVAEMVEANERTLGIANVDEIMAIPGIDVGWLSHFDLINIMGIPGQFNISDFLAAADRLVTACSRHGKAAGFLPPPELAHVQADKGFCRLGYSTDVALMQNSLVSGIAMLRVASAPR